MYKYLYIEKAIHFKNDTIKPMLKFDLESLDNNVLNPEIKQILQALPDLDLKILRDNINNGEKPKGSVSSLFTEIQVKKMAEIDFNPSESLNIFIKADLIRITNVFDESIQKKFLKSLEFEGVISLIEILFWIVHLIKFFPEETKAVKELRAKITNPYSVYFEAIPSCRSEILTILQFSVAYLIHGFHYRLFPNERIHFNIRFILDCYHIVIYILTGLIVSDYYIHTHIEKFFGDRFFQYQQGHWGRVIEEQKTGSFDANKDMSLVGDYGSKVFNTSSLENSRQVSYIEIQRPDDTSKNNFAGNNAGNSQIFTPDGRTSLNQSGLSNNRKASRDIRELSSKQEKEDSNSTVNLSRQISARFNKLQKISSSKSAMIYARLQNEMFVTLNELSKDYNCEDV